MISWTDLLGSKITQLDQGRYHLNTRLQVVVWNITSRCNLRCQHCYFEATGKIDPNELKSKEARDFIEDLAEFKVPVLLFSGGEPLLRKDIFELAKFAKDRGIKPVLSTNGSLITEEVAKKIKQAGFSYVGISLDGMEQTNDCFRRKKGAFTQTLVGIRNCQKVGLKVGLRFTLTKHNFKDLAYMFDLVEQESIPRFCIYHLVYIGRAGNNRVMDLSHKEKRQALEIIWQRSLKFCQRGLNIEVLTVDNHADGVWLYLKLKSLNPQKAKRALGLLKAQGGNSSGEKIGAVDNCGNIYPDQFWRTHLLGNIRKSKFSKVWQENGSSFLQDLRHRSLLLKGRCQRCIFLLICNGNFRARAEAVFKDPWAPDPACYLTEKEISEDINYGEK